MVRQLTLSQYAFMAEILGRGGQMASEAVNCSAPDTGNMGKHYTCLRALSLSSPYRGPGTIRVTGTAEDLATPIVEWRDPVGILDD